MSISSDFLLPDPPVWRTDRRTELRWLRRAIAVPAVARKNRNDKRPVINDKTRISKKLGLRNPSYQTACAVLSSWLYECRSRVFRISTETASAVTSTEFEYLSKSTSKWPKSYLSRSKSNAQKSYSSKSKKVPNFFSTWKVKSKSNFLMICFVFKHYYRIFQRNTFLFI